MVKWIFLLPAGYHLLNYVMHETLYANESTVNVQRQSFFFPFFKRPLLSIYLCDNAVCLILHYNVLLCVFQLIKSNPFRLNWFHMWESASTFDSKDETMTKVLSWSWNALNAFNSYLFSGVTPGRSKLSERICLKSPWCASPLMNNHQKAHVPREGRIHRAQEFISYLLISTGNWIVRIRELLSQKIANWISNNTCCKKNWKWWPVSIKSSSVYG